MKRSRMKGWGRWAAGLAALVVAACGGSDPGDGAAAAAAADERRAAAGVASPARAVDAESVRAEPAQRSNRLVTVDVIGPGMVISSPDGIECGARCRASFGVGQRVTLVAIPSTHHLFNGWAGACTGRGPCVVPIERVSAVAAEYVPSPTGTRPLSVALVGGTGAGSVASTNGAILCGPVCSNTIPVGDTLTLEATPAPGHVFTGWAGACEGTGSCTVTVKEMTLVAARFEVAGIARP